MRHYRLRNNSTGEILGTFPGMCEREALETMLGALGVKEGDACERFPSGVGVLEVEKPAVN